MPNRTHRLRQKPKIPIINPHWLRHRRRLRIWQLQQPLQKLLTIRRDVEEHDAKNANHACEPIVAIVTFAKT